MSFEYVTELMDEVEHLRRALTFSNEIREAEKKILIKEIEDHTATKKGLAECRKHLADANRGAQGQSEVNQLLVKEMHKVRDGEQPSEFEEVRKCDFSTPGTITHYQCLACNGTGEIIRTLTVGEALEVLKNIITCHDGFPKSEACDGLLLKSGGRVRLKK